MPCFFHIWEIDKRFSIFLQQTIIRSLVWQDLECILKLLFCPLCLWLKYKHFPDNKNEMCSVVFVVLSLYVLLSCYCLYRFSEEERQWFLGDMLSGESYCIFRIKTNRTKYQQTHHTCLLLVTLTCLLNLLISGCLNGMYVRLLFLISDFSTSFLLPIFFSLFSCICYFSLCFNLAFIPAFFYLSVSL